MAFGVAPPGPGPSAGLIDKGPRGGGPQFGGAPGGGPGAMPAPPIGGAPGGMNPIGGPTPAMPAGPPIGGGYGPPTMPPIQPGPPTQPPPQGVPVPIGAAPPIPNPVGPMPIGGGGTQVNDTAPGGGMGYGQGGGPGVNPPPQITQPRRIQNSGTQQRGFRRGY